MKSSMISATNTQLLRVRRPMVSSTRASFTFIWTWNSSLPEPAASSGKLTQFKPCKLVTSWFDCRVTMRLKRISL
jgi:hypothetical protein